MERLGLVAQLEAELERSISLGLVPQGGKLPSERALASHYGVCRSTAREALGLGRIYEADGRLEDARACYGRAAGFDLSAFKLDDQEQVEDREGWLRARLDALLDYMDLFAGLP